MQAPTQVIWLTLLKIREPFEPDFSAAPLAPQQGRAFYTAPPRCQYPLSRAPPATSRQLQREKANISESLTSPSTPRRLSPPPPWPARPGSPPKQARILASQIKRSSGDRLGHSIWRPRRRQSRPRRGRTTWRNGYGLTTVTRAKRRLPTWNTWLLPGARRRSASSTLSPSIRTPPCLIMRSASEVLGTSPAALSN